jgi:hypothetical protein
VDPLGDSTGPPADQERRAGPGQYPGGHGRLHPL